MPTKSTLTKLGLLIGLLALAIVAHRLARSASDLWAGSTPNLPPLSRVNLPPQSAKGITAAIESYYADGSLLLFKIRVEGPDQPYTLDRFSVTNSNNEELNTGYSWFPLEKDPSVTMLEMVPAYAISNNRLDGQLSFSVYSADPEKPLTRFHFKLDAPIEPAQTYLLNGGNFLYNDAAFNNPMYLDRIVVSPSFTWAYLCYAKPSEADWMIGRGASLKIQNQSADVANYNLLYDSSLGDGTKGGEPGWSPVGNYPRCVKVGFPIGSEVNYPTKLTLTIPALEQSMPEVVPQADLDAAYPKLRAQGIDMDGGAYPEWKKLPAGMSEQEAYQKFIEALGYVYKGPWIYDIHLEPRQSSQPVFSTTYSNAPTPIPLSSDEPPFASVDARINSFDVHPDGKMIALATSQGIVLVDMETHKPLHTVDKEDGLFSNVKWSPDGTKLAAWNILLQADENGTPNLIVWNTDHWDVIRKITSDQEVSIEFGALAWSPDGKMLAASYPERGLTVVNVNSGKTVSEQKDFLITPYDMDWSPDGSRLIANGDLGYGIRRWRLDTGETVRLYDSRSASTANQLAWSPDGKRIASIHEYGTVCFWTVATNECDGLIQIQEYTFGLAWSPDGKRLATGGNVIRIWDSHTGNLLTSFGQTEVSAYTRLEWLNENTLIACETDFAANTARIRLWNVETGQVIWEIRGTEESAP